MTTSGIGAADAAIYMGVCLENTDPTGQGRIKYCVPQLSGSTAFGWAMPVAQGVTPIGSTVYVAFEGGDRNRPLFWPDQPIPFPPIPPAIPRYATFAALEAAYPTTAPAPIGSQYWVDEYGGTVQWQLNGVTSTSATWQWLPSGYQDSSSLSATVTATSTADVLLNQVALDNPSTHRIYSVSANVMAYSVDTADMQIELGLSIGTTTNPSSKTPGASYDYITYQQLNSVIGNVAGITVSTSIRPTTTGRVYVGFWLSIGGSGSGTASSYQTYQLTVSDIGAAL